MGDFPARVNTETGSPHYDNNPARNGGRAAVMVAVDMTFIRSIPAILMIVEVVLGLLHWSLIVSTPFLGMSPYIWVLFVAITLWILTIFLFMFLLLNVQQNMPAVPWSLVVMVYHIVASVLYLIAFAVNAAYVELLIYFGHLAAAAFFGCVVMLAYFASAFFSFMDWKRDRGNDATNTVPT